jgi:hypothetical protein
MNTDLTQDEVIDNILIIMETFKDELTSFSRRDSHRLRQWAKFLTDDGEVVKKSKIDSKKKYSRYQALNLTNDNTIEFRIFKSTTDLKTFVATVELVDNIVNLAKGNINGLTWDKIVAKGRYLQDVSNKLVGTTDTVVKLDDVLNVEVKKMEGSSDLEPIPFTLSDGRVFHRGDKVLYNGYDCSARECIFLETDGFSVLLYMGNDFGGHSGNGINNHYVPTEYSPHCWWVSYHEIGVLS